VLDTQRSAKSLPQSLAPVILQDMGNDFERIGDLTEIEIIAVNLSIRERRRLRE
jgi:hypothetical protein